MTELDALSFTDDFLLSSYTQDKSGRTNFMNTSRVVINAFTKQNENGEDLCTLCIANDSRIERYKNEKHWHVRAFMQHMEGWSTKSMQRCSLLNIQCLN